MQTINVKYLSATNTKGARIKASCEGGSVTISRSYSDNVEADYMAAAKALKDKLGWAGDMVGGHTKDGMVFVFPTESYKIK
jgi:hypothetical protein